jgi:hypothetical protein
LTQRITKCYADSMSGIKWKTFINSTIEGKPFKDDAAAFNRDKTLLQRITNMPKADKKISIHMAYNMHLQEIMSCLFDDHNVDKAGDVYQEDWVTWVSKQGYQIILKGDEYDI